MRKLLRLISLSFCVSLVACGGGGGNPGSNSGGSVPPGGGAGTTVAKVEVLASAQTLPPSTTSGVTITVIAKDAANNALASQPVSFSASSGVLSSVSATTGADGTATAVLTAGSDSSTRDITVTAKSGSASGSVVITVTPVVSPATVVEVGASATSLRSADTTGVTVTAVVKDNFNNVQAGQAVSFVATSGVLGKVTSTTGADGRATAVLTAGTDRSARTITVTVRAGASEGKIALPVEGTTLNVAGSTSLLVGASTTFAVSLKDSSGNAIAGQPISVSSSLGNEVTLARPVTDNSGATSFNYVASRSGADVLSVSGAGIQQVLPLSISNINFAFTAPAPGTEAAVDERKIVTVRYLENGVGVSGRTVSFATTRGGVSPSNVVTDADGYATTEVLSSSAGPASVSAQLGTTVTTLPLNFIAKVPQSLNLQVSSAALAPNASGSSVNQVELRATVRDAAGNAVKGVTVNFAAVKDLSGGRIKTGTAITDANGLATDSFIAGALSTAANGVEIRATVAGTTISSMAPLTVSGQSLFINIASNNTIEKLNTTYRKTFSVQVNDANGAPVPGQNVTLSYFPPSYRKGYMRFNEVGVPPMWVIAEATQCENEDLNKDGQMALVEDDPNLEGGRGNGDGRLTPGLPGLIAPAFVTTNTAGSVEFTLEYGQQYAFWVDFDLTAKAVVSGTESSAIFHFRASALASDLTEAGVEPASKNSPFGRATSCRDRN